MAPPPRLLLLLYAGVQKYIWRASAADAVGECAPENSSPKAFNSKREHRVTYNFTGPPSSLASISAGSPMLQLDEESVKGCKMGDEVLCHHAKIIQQVLPDTGGKNLTVSL